MNPALEERRVAVHVTVVDDSDILDKHECAVKNLIDHTVASVRFVNRWHEEHDLDTVTGP